MPTLDLDRSEIKGALMGGSVAAVVLFATGIGVGQVHSFEALEMIHAVQPGSRFLGSTAIGAGITVLALMLTLIGLSMNADLTFHKSLYRRAHNITTLSVASIVGGVLLLLAVGVPISEVEEIRNYYSILYYLLTGAMAIVGGLLVATGLLIGSTLRALIRVQHPEATSEFLEEALEDDDEGDEESSEPISGEGEDAQQPEDVH